MANDPYHDIAAYFEAEHEGASADVAWFARNDAGGTLLVLGCGAGRVCRGLEALRPVIGIDRSARMLGRAHAFGGTTRYVEGDIRDFDVGKVGEVIVPNATFCFLHTRADQLACLRSIHRALPDGAPVTLDLPAPDFALLGVPHTPERVAWEGDVGGRHLRRTREVWRRPIAGRVDLLDRYFADGDLVATALLPLQLAFPRELEWMLETAGFWVDAFYGDYAGGPLREGCDRLIVRAVRG